MIKVDTDALHKALENVANEALAAELRNAIIFGPPVLCKVFNEYLRLAELNDRAERTRASFEGYKERCTHGVRWENRCPTCDAQPAQTEG